MATSFNKLIDKKHRGKSASQLADLAPDALLGVSAGDAERLAASFGIDTVREFANEPSRRAAAAIASAADDVPGFDPGPPPKWEVLFNAAPLATYQARPDLFRLDFGPVFYRGRLDGTARVLVVGQDPSVNEILAQRVFVGRSGQKLQGFLAKLGLTRSYVMLNTFSYSIFDQFGGDNETLSHQDPILGYRNTQFDRVAEDNPLQAVLTVGSGAREAVDRWPGALDLTRVHLIHPAFPDTAQLLQNWNSALTQLRPLAEPDDDAPLGADYGTSFGPGEITSIPRRDLPFGLPPWHGDGDHGARDGNMVIEWHSQPVS